MVKAVETKKRKASVAESGTEKVKKPKKVESSPVIAKKRKATDDEAVPAVKKPKKSAKTTSTEDSIGKANGKSKPAKSTKPTAIVETEVVVESEPQAADADQDEGDVSEIDDQTEALLQGFESDSDEEMQDAANEDAYVAGQDIPVPKLTKSQKKKMQAALADAESQKPGVIYVGRIPHGFYEHGMKEYFKQFGTILNLRLSRNRKTGRSKHYAFVQFESAEVATIVSKTMDNYLMFGHLLKVKMVPNDQISPDLWKGANKRFKTVPWNKMEGRKLKAPASEKVWDARVERAEERRNKKAAKLLEIGYQFEAPKLKSAKGLAQEHLEAPAVVETEPEVVKEDVEDVKETPVVEPATKPKNKNKRKAAEEAPVADDAIIANSGKEANKPKKNKKAKTVDTKTVVEEIVPVVETPVEEPTKPKKKGKKSMVEEEVVVAPEEAVEAAEESAKPKKKAKKAKVADSAEILDETPSTEPATKPKKGKKSKITETTEVTVIETPADLPEKKVKAKKVKVVEDAVVPEEKVKKTRKGRKSV
ncbi:hypothetical protein HYFRA_00007722 [Hymenoscyphus fraxineus]|uniref:RRM domain-containing protein n=1 Tax=Hymenoscyphus fraxineus TaxID=746836 RepID=A0A9N9PPI8_9HELO|nr:hypothetical protein HYFRA_00007722 [Hymenoscyphus fraxineus]